MLLFNCKMWPLKLGTLCQLFDSFVGAVLNLYVLYDVCVSVENYILCTQICSVLFCSYLKVFTYIREWEE